MRPLFCGRSAKLKGSRTREQEISVSQESDSSSFHDGNAGFEWGEIESHRFYGSSRHSMRTFPRQDAAISYLDSLQADQHCLSKLFCYETMLTGQRRFLVADVVDFEHKYYRLPQNDCHVYEIIREATPCRLYLDIEFSKAANPCLDGDALTYKWLMLLIWKLKELFNLALDLRDCLVLDSTTESKFSKHVVVQCTSSNDQGNRVEYLFSSNAEVGLLIKLIVAGISRPATESTEPFIFLLDGQARLPKKEYEEFWVFTALQDHEEGVSRKTLFVDTGVYTRNRAFRLFKSCKYGKKRSLGCSQFDQHRYKRFAFEGNAELTSSDILRNSFVVPHDLFKSVKSRLSANTTLVMSSRYCCLKSTPCKPPSSMAVAFTFSNSNSSSTTEALDTIGHEHRNSVVGQRRLDVIAKSTSYKQSSLFPLLDEWVQGWVNARGGTIGSITSWMLFAQRRGDFPRFFIRYLINRNRFCSNVGREHKSNGIFIDADLMDRMVTQGCWDIDCSGFRSSPTIIPQHVLPAPAEVHHLVIQYIASTNSQPSHC